MPVWGIDTTWTLNGDGNWSVPANWNNGVPVNGTFNAIIDDGDSAVTVTLNVNATTGTLTVGANDTLTFGESFDLTIAGTSLVNNGVIALNALGVLNVNTDLNFTAPVATMSGSGTLQLGGASQNRVTNSAPTNELINGPAHTIAGGGQLGFNGMKITNQGTINANLTSLLMIDPSASGVVNQSTGVMRGSGSAGLQLTGGAFDNQGTIEALNGSNVTYTATAVTSNNVTGVLTGGTWRSVAGGGGATITLRGSNITQVAAGTTVELSGAGSVLQVGATPIDSTLTANTGTLRILNNRNYTAVPALALTNAGTLEIGGGAFTSTVLTNTAGGEIFGFGTITPRPVNSGTIRAAGGTLTLGQGIQGASGTVRTDAGATLDVSGGALGSSADTLIHNGAGLILGPNNFSVGVDYQNANFGVGNAFNPRANVTGAGQIQASPGVAQSLSGNVANGGTATATMAFGNLHVGESATLNYQINNVGALGPTLRGAIQTAVGGATLTDARLSGSGVTAGNFAPISVGANSGNLGVTFNATAAGALAGQQVRIVNNFDNVGNQTLQITGAAYRYANPTAHTPEPVNFGIVHVGDVLSQALSITNNVPNDGFSERLDASIGSPSGSATTNSGSFSALLPGATNNSSLVVGIDTTTAGAKTGTAKISLTSNGTGTSGLANTSLPDQTVNLSATVNNFAVATIVKPSGAGTLTPTGPNAYTLDLGTTVEGQGSLSAMLGVKNDATAPADSLAGSFTLAAPGYSLSGFSSFNNLAAGATQGGLTVTLPSNVAGTISGQITLSPQSTNPRPFSMNLPTVTINLTGRVFLAADFQQDGDVDGGDLATWRVGFGTATGATHLTGDADGDSAAGGRDFLVWQRQFGANAPIVGAGVAVPEPVSLALLIFGGLFAHANKERRAGSRRL